MTGRQPQKSAVRKGGTGMLSTTARRQNTPNPLSVPRRRAPSNTATFRALTDVGESIVSGVYAIYSPVRLYLCVTMTPKPDALAAQREADRRQAAGLFEVNEHWSAAAVNARWGRRAVLTDENGHPIAEALRGARGMTDAGAKECFFEFSGMTTYPDKMYLTTPEARVRVR